MKKWIRWKGLIVFMAAVVVIVLVWMFLVDTVVRRTIETVGTRAVGARVDLAKADLSLFPAGLSLRGLAVTNPDAPMQNAIEIAHMKMDLEAGHLLRRKVIINEMTLEGLRFNTKRRRSGAVPALAAEKKSRPDEKAEPGKTGVGAVKKLCGDFNIPSLSKSDVGDILAGESLDSVTLAHDLDARLKSARADWEKQLQELPDEKKIKAYQTRVEALAKGGGGLSALLASAGKVKQLDEDIRKDLNRLEKARDSFTNDYKTYERQVSDLAKAPEKDIQRLMKKYSLSPDGLANLSQMIFGERLCGWVQTAANWYRKLKPYIAKATQTKDRGPEAQKPLRGKGRNIRFAETPPVPDFLIRHLKLNAMLDAGTFTGKVENITAAQDVLGRPMTFAFLGRQMKRIKALDLSGIADYVKPGSPKGNGRLAVTGLAIQDLVLVKEASFPLALQQAASDLNLDLKMVGNQWDAKFQGDFSAARFAFNGEKPPTGMADAMMSALAGVERFSLNADIAGSLAAYTVNVSSDLDRVLKSAVGNLVKKESAKLASGLRQQISARLEGPLNQARSGLADLGGIEDELAKRLNLSDDLLKNLKLSL